MINQKPLILCILDGWGLNPSKKYNAIEAAHTPNFDLLWKGCPHTTLRADGLAVGLPEGQFGNSEVGHTNIGAGRVVMQDLPRITLACQDGTLARNEELIDFIEELRVSGGTAHLMGLISDGGVHAHQDHMIALAEILVKQDIPVVIHAFTDGRDTPPNSALAYMRDFIKQLPNNVKIVSVCGRFFAMDRDNRWERVQQAWQAIVRGKGLQAPDAMKAIQQSYTKHEMDEFIKPTIIGDYMGFQPGDGLLMANFRSDRAREILRALVQKNFTSFDRGVYSPLTNCVGMVEYADDLNPYLKTLFKSETLDDLLGETLAKSGLRQIRAAETEKYPHVTFFFNGGREEPFPNEERLLVASPKVATYDLKPEMSAVELTDRLIPMLAHTDVVILNYANPDMVGHTGDMQATTKAVETVDACLGRLAAAISDLEGVLVVTADHGNADLMLDEKTGQPHTAHTTNPVPFIIAGTENYTLKENGALGDIAPTLLALLNIEKPAAMTGKSLIK
jgi:2,3-bisphosphoglycerate-independent phosphoglycerate mutase